MEHKLLLRPGQTEFNRIASTNGIFEAVRVGDMWFIHRGKLAMAKFLNGKITYLSGGRVSLEINEQIELLHLQINCVHAELREQTQRITDTPPAKRKL